MAAQQEIIAMTGATGFVGSNLRHMLGLADCTVLPLGRGDFHGETATLARKMAGARVVINLAGAPIIGRWSAEYKKTLYASRVDLTKKLVAAFSQLESKPETFISTSAVGIYASSGCHTEEEFTKADNFLGKLTSDWEEAALAAEEQGVRTVIFRFGVVLGKGGGVLQKMLTPFRLGLGGAIGNGRQSFSWIHIDDLRHAYKTAMQDPSFRGIYNLTAPEATTNKEFTKELGRVLSRPTILPVPEFVLNLLFGEGAQVLTSGQNAYPQRLLDSGFVFRYGHLRDALQNSVS